VKALNLAKVFICIFISVLFLNIKGKEHKGINTKFKEGKTQHTLNLKKDVDIFCSISIVNESSILKLVGEEKIFASLIDNAGRKIKQFNSKEILISGEDLLSGKYFLAVNNEKPIKITVIDHFILCDGAFVEEEEEEEEEEFEGPAYKNPDLPIEERVNDLLSRMTLQEKIDQLSGDPKLDGFTTKYNDNLEIPQIKCVDCPHGVRWGNATFFPVPIAFGSTWDVDLVEEAAGVIGRECRAKGRNMGLAPCINLIRDPRGGRVFETYSEDSYMLSQMALAYVNGLQSQKVIATPKHYICNNSEDVRWNEAAVQIDERTLREVYLPIFRRPIVTGQAWSIMGAYNGVNGEYCCYNEWILREILKEELGFEGFVVSDWGACHSTISSIKAGLDLEMPRTNYYGEALLQAVEDGDVAVVYIDEAVRRILRAKFWAGLFDGIEPVDESVVESPEHISVALELAKKSIVLLKNEGSVLPLDEHSIDSIGVIGPNANTDFRGQGGSSAVTSSYAVNVLDGIINKVGDSIEVMYAEGCEIGTEHAPSYIPEITDSVKFQQALDVAEKSDVVILVVGLSGAIESEGNDRAYLIFPGVQEQLIKEVISRNSNAILVLKNGSPLTTVLEIDTMSLFEACPAILEAWYPGQEGGTAVADVIFGDYNPGGKLPLTFPKSASDLPTWDFDYTNDYTEGRGYRYFDKQGIEPLFPFGHGLSYTEFEYSNLQIIPMVSLNRQITVRVDVTNVGDMEGDEVVQLYIYDVERSTDDQPIKELKGFSRITLAPAERQTVEFKLTPEHLAFHDEQINFLVEPGRFDVMVGSSSRDIRLEGFFYITEEIRIR